MAIFMQYGAPGEIRGGAHHVGYEGWIELEEVQLHELPKAGTPESAQIERSGSTSALRELSATKHADHASHGLRMQMLVGGPKTVTIHYVKPTGGPMLQLYFSLALSGARILSFVDSDHSGGENLTLAFTKLEATRVVLAGDGQEMRIPVRLDSALLQRL